MNWQGPGVYQHFKGKLYFALGLAKHERSGESYVVYIPLYPVPGHQMTLRTLSAWNEEVNGAARFHKVDPQ